MRESYTEVRIAALPTLRQPGELIAANKSRLFFWCFDAGCICINEKVITGWSSPLETCQRYVDVFSRNHLERSGAKANHKPEGGIGEQSVSQVAITYEVKEMLLTNAGGRSMWLQQIDTAQEKCR